MCGRLMRSRPATRFASATCATVFNSNSRDRRVRPDPLATRSGSTAPTPEPIIAFASPPPAMRTGCKHSDTPLPLHTMHRLLFLLALTMALPASAQGQSLFSDPKAHQAGDVLTIILAER